MSACAPVELASFDRVRIGLMLLDRMDAEDMELYRETWRRETAYRPTRSETAAVAWHTASRTWLKLWKITNFWWRIAGEGQHAPGMPGSKRSRDAFELEMQVPNAR